MDFFLFSRPFQRNIPVKIEWLIIFCFKIIDIYTFSSNFNHSNGSKRNLYTSSFQSLIKFFSIEKVSFNRWDVCWHVTYSSWKIFVFLGGAVKKKTHSIFKDIAQIGGREVNAISKSWKKMIFWQQLEREGVTKHIVKNRSTLFCMTYYSIWPNQGILCISVCTHDPQKVIVIIENVSFTA